MGKWTRRTFIGVGGLLGGGLVLGVGGVALAPNRLRIAPGSAAGSSQLTTWIKVTPANDVIAIVPHCEMGQGALTGLGMMLAEELEADFDRVRIEEAPAEYVYANGYILRGFMEETGLEIPSWLERALDYASYKVSDIAGLQITGGSSSTRATGQYGMRVAGAAAKAMLLEAAALKFNVPATECVAKDSMVAHAASGRRASFAELADLAATLRPPQRPALKSPADYTIVGTSKPRADIPSKVDGMAKFGIDVALPDMLYAAVSAAPVPGERLSSVDPAPALAKPGVERVVELADAVAVVASGYWQAEQALRSLSPVYADGGRRQVDSEQLFSALAAALDDEQGVFDSARRAPAFVAAEYRVPYLAHATMEPMSATARIAEGRCEVWAGTQDPLNARGIAAAAAGFDVENVVMHNMQLGGGFGRRLPGAFDYIDQAVRIAKAMAPRPVKLVWSREEDMQHDYYRPAVLARLGGALDTSGMPISWTALFTGEPFIDASAARPPYSIADKTSKVIEPPAHLRTGSWRSVAFSQHGFFMESFIDEMAHHAGRDPYEYRRELLVDKPRHLAVLDRAAALGGWGGSPMPGHGLGIALVECFGSIVAEVVDVGVDATGRVRVHRVDAAVDCGSVVNPDQALAQVEGAILFGVSAALFHRITVRDGRVEQRSFPEYPMIKLADAPRVNVEFIESGAALGGLGEPGVPPVAPAIANGIFAATGRRLRTLPLGLV